MKIISHRGNIDGPCKEENHPSQIQKALRKGIDCEIDIWCLDKKLYLGHDNPQYETENKFLSQSGLWIHAKNLDALNWLRGTQFNYFWHQEDKATITSHGYIWCYPGIFIKHGITVLRNREEHFPKKILGICTDYPKYYS